MNEQEKSIRQRWESYAEQQICAAQEEGLFDNLPGFGQPIAGIDEVHDELWWVREKLKREKLSALPPALSIKVDIEKTLANLESLHVESDMRRELLALNDRIRAAQRNAVWGPACDVMPLDVEEIVSQRREEGGL